MAGRNSKGIETDEFLSRVLRTKWIFPDKHCGM